MARQQPSNSVLIANSDRIRTYADGSGWNASQGRQATPAELAEANRSTYEVRVTPAADVTNGQVVAITVTVRHDTAEGARALALWVLGDLRHADDLTVREV